MVNKLKQYWKSISSFLFLSWLWFKTQPVSVLIAGFAADRFADCYDLFFGIPSIFSKAHANYFGKREFFAWTMAFLIKMVLFGITGFYLHKTLSFFERYWRNFKGTDVIAEKERLSIRRTPSPVLHSPSPLLAANRPVLEQIDAAASLSRPSATNLQYGVQDGSSAESLSRPASSNHLAEDELSAALAASPFQEGADLKSSFMAGASANAWMQLQKARAPSAPAAARRRSGSDLPLLPEPEVFEPPPVFIPSRASGDGDPPERVRCVAPREESVHLRSRPPIRQPSPLGEVAASPLIPRIYSPSAGEAAAPAAAPIMESAPEASQPFLLSNIFARTSTFTPGNVPADLLRLQMAFHQQFDPNGQRKPH